MLISLKEMHCIPFKPPLLYLLGKRPTEVSVCISFDRNRAKVQKGKVIIMKNCVTKISMVEDVYLVTFEKAPAGSAFLSKLFSAVADAGINIDMISQTTIMGDFVTLSFTLGAESLGEIMTLANSIREKHPTLKPIIKGGNAKIWLYGEDMANYVGVGAQAFSALQEKGIVSS